MKTYGLIGYPLSHSFSRQYFLEKFKKENIKDVEFKNFELEDIGGLGDLLLTEHSLQGFAITIPYKRSIVEFLNKESVEVKKTGACNCVRIWNDKLYGYNTDVLGFEKSFVPHLRPWHKKALVLGTGGAAAAVEFVLEKIGLTYVKISRQGGASGLSYSDIDAALMEECYVVINCTPVGTVPDIEKSPAIPYHLLSPLHYCYDLVYNPAITKFLQLAHDRGSVIKNGYDMLAFQAEANWMIWNDLKGTHNIL